MESSASDWNAAGRTRSPILLGLALVAVGAFLSAASFGSLPLLTRLEQHAQRVTQVDAARADRRASATAAAAAVQSLDIVWDAYAPKIAAVQSGLDGKLDARALLAFRAAIARQYNDTAPADVLDQLPSAVADRPEYAARRAAFRAVFDGTRRDIRAVFARITRALRPHAVREPDSAASADAAAVDALFAAEAQLAPRWGAIRESAADAASDTAAQAERADADALQAESENPWEALVNP